MTLRPRTIPVGSIHNSNIVCFKCREAARFWSRVRCPNCGEVMEHIGFRFKVPKKHSKQRWKKLEMKFRKIKGEIDTHGSIIPLRNSDNKTIPMTIGHRGIVKPKYNRAKENDNANFDEL